MSGSSGSDASSDSPKLRGFKCTTCGIAFASTHVLGKHTSRRTRPGNRPFPVGFPCDMKNMRPKSLRKHHYLLFSLLVAADTLVSHLESCTISPTWVLPGCVASRHVGQQRLRREQRLPEAAWLQVYHLRDSVCKYPCARQAHVCWCVLVESTRPQSSYLDPSS